MGRDKLSGRNRLEVVYVDVKWYVDNDSNLLKVAQAGDRLHISSLSIPGPDLVCGFPMIMEC